MRRRGAVVWLRGGRRVFDDARRTFARRSPGVLLVLVGGIGGVAFAGICGALGASIAWRRWTHYARATTLVEGMEARPVPTRRDRGVRAAAS